MHRSAKLGILAALAGLLAPTPARSADPPPPPRVVASWPSGPMEVRVAFDRAVDPSALPGWIGRAFTFDDPTRPGTRGSIAIAAASLVDGGRTLILATDPHPREATYAAQLPGLKGTGEPGPGATLDISHDLRGVVVGWSAGAGPEWSGWWPALDLGRCRDRLRGSAAHESGFARLGRPGHWTAQTLLTLPSGRSTLAIASSGPFEATAGVESAKSTADAAGVHRAAVPWESTGEAGELALDVETGVVGKAFDLTVTYGPEGVPADRPLPMGSLAMPWAPASPAAEVAPTEAAPVDLAGADRGRGEVVFRGEAAKCSTCHRVRGEGGVVGPDLSDLVGRDPAWVSRQVAEPGTSIHPDYASWVVARRDGRIAMGTVRAEGANAIRVADVDAKVTVIPKLEVEELRPSPTSTMPAGLPGAIGEPAMRDLLLYLTTPPPAR